jgi:nicotinate-nucleotide adenylyltransferase
MTPPSPRPTRVALYGGSLDPTHVGHVVAAASIALSGEVDRVLVVPCYQQAGKALAPFESRLAMARKAFAWVPRAEVSDVEGRLGGESLTLRTVKHLLAEHPDWALRFAVGADTYERGPTWGEAYWAELCALAPPIVVGRVGYRYHHLPPPPAASSTAVREAARRGDWETVGGLVPAPIFADVMALYRPDGKSPGWWIGRSPAEAPDNNRPDGPLQLRH